MKILAAICVALLLLLTGCSGPAYYWYHPDRSLEEAEADYRTCQEDAKHKSADMIGGQHYDRLPPPEDASDRSVSPRERNRVAAGAGETQDAWRDQYERSVIGEGMKAKGYLKLSPEHIPHGVHTLRAPRTPRGRRPAEESRA
jgi:hypothetical protein